MNEVRAFVGHSFLPEDAALVQEFIAYFDQVKSVVPAFTWEHAVASEPREIRDKVLAIIQDKNVFIGICTKKERVAPGGEFRPRFWRRGSMTVPQDKLQWKTSDWVIQEVGLAIGRGMDLILLVEQGVRVPGGIQGNIEHIEFSREAPSKVFGRLLEMIRALSPPAGAAASGPAVGEAAAQESPAPDKVPEHSTASPTPEWTRIEYRGAFFARLLHDDPAGALTISEAYLATPDAAEGERKVEWEADVEFLSMALGKGGNLARLRELAAAYPTNPKILSTMASGLERFGGTLEAAQAYEAAAAAASDPADLLRYLCEAAMLQAKTGQIDVAASTIERAKAASPADAESEKRLLLRV